MARKKVLQRFFLPAKGNRALVLDVIKRLPIDQSFDIEITDHVEKRSQEANRLAWKVAGEMAKQVQIEGKRHSREVWWWHLKREFWGPDLMTLPTGEVIEREPQSHNRNRQDFSEFLEFVMAKAAELDVVLGDD